MAAVWVALPSAVSVLWCGSSFVSTSLKGVPNMDMVWQQFWRHFPQKGTIPSGQRASNLMAAVFFDTGNHILVCWVILAYAGFFLLVLSAAEPAGSHCHWYEAVHGHPITGHPITSHLWQPYQTHLRPDHWEESTQALPTDSKSLPPSSQESTSRKKVMTVESRETWSKISRQFLSLQTHF